MSVRPGDKVYVQGTTLADPLLRALLASILKAEGHPYMRVLPPGAEEILYRCASEDQLQHIAPAVRLVYETYDAMITVWSAANTKELTSIAPQRLVVAQRAAGVVLQTLMQRTAKGELRWVGVLFPTLAYAQDAEMGLAE